MNGNLEGIRLLYDVDVKNLVQRTRDILSVRFAKPDGFNYLAGQYMFITLEVGGGDITKHLTISSSPTEKFLEITKRLTGHPFANALSSLEPGDVVRIKGPYGKFVLGDYKKIGMLSGGIGITPLRSMIRYSADKAINTDIVLIYSNKNENDIGFKDEFQELQRYNPNLKVIYTITEPSRNWNGLTGRINSEMIMKCLPDYRERVFYISGPAQMANAMQILLSDLKIPENRIRKEYFSGFDLIES
jgi:ferredoxin-NADP reductase